MTNGSNDEPFAREDQQRDAVGHLIRAAGRRPAPRGEDYQRVYEASREAWHRKVRSSRRRRWWYAVAAALAAAAIGLVAVTQFSPPPTAALAAVLQGRVELLADEGWQPLAEVGAEIPAGARLRTVADGRAAFELADGVSLRVNSATEWVFASRDRIELIAGMVYVDSGTGRPENGIEISTAFGVIRDIGTQFEVMALMTRLRVRVREGLVSLQLADEPEPVETAAGEQLLVDMGGAVQRRAVRADAAEWAWAQALAEPLRIEGRSAFDVLGWVARETGKRLVFEDANAELRARNAILSGSSRNLTPMEALDVVVATSGGLDYVLSEGTIIIRRR
jgi:ferric-dicitrate binding protein FerR (iron transport regulator)